MMHVWLLTAERRWQSPGSGASPCVRRAQWLFWKGSTPSSSRHYSTLLEETVLRLLRNTSPSGHFTYMVEDAEEESLR